MKSLSDVGKVVRVILQGIADRHEGIWSYSVLGEIKPARTKAVMPLAPRQPVLIVSRVHLGGQPLLAQVVDAGDSLGTTLGLGQSGQKHPGEDRDDGDDHQQFNQGEPGAS